MLFLIVPLCVVVVKKVAYAESLISLRDYDYIGEDNRLMSLLAERMAMLREPVAQTNADEHSNPNLTKDRFKFKKSRVVPNFLSSPDQMELNLRRYNKYRVNISMDYAELFGISEEFTPALNTSRPWFNPPQSVTGLNFTSDLGFLDSKLTASRRFYVWDPKAKSMTEKILLVMKQLVYSVKTRIEDIEPLIKKYDSGDIFRVAIIFTKLDYWLKELRSLYFAMIKEREYPFRFVTQLYYYQHALRKNIDISYSVELLTHMHSAYMAKMEQVFPVKDRKALEMHKKMKEEMKQKEREERDRKAS